VAPVGHSGAMENNALFSAVGPFDALRSTSPDSPYVLNLVRSSVYGPTSCFKLILGLSGGDNHLKPRHDGQISSGWSALTHNWAWQLDI